MQIVITANGADLDAPTSPVFGRCSNYVFVDTETMNFRAVSNPAMAAGGGAGIQAAQYVIEEGAQAVVTGNLGPNAHQVFQAAGIPAYLFPGGTVRQAVEAFQAGQLQVLGQANVAAHAGMGRGMGRGMGQGMGRGMGRGMGMGAAPVTPPPATPTSAPSEEPGLAELQEAASNLRQQLAEIMERLEKRDKGGE